jgi:hypothetical protein
VNINRKQIKDLSNFLEHVAQAAPESFQDEAQYLLNQIAPKKADFIHQLPPQFSVKISYKFYRVPVSGNRLKKLLRTKGKPDGSILYPITVNRRNHMVHWRPNGGISYCDIELRANEGHDLIATVRGVATCSMSEEFDYDTAKSLAHERAIFALKALSWAFNLQPEINTKQKENET